MLTPDLAVWKDLTRRFQAQVFCGLFLGDENKGMRLAPATLMAVGSRGLVLDFDIYGAQAEA
jgi:hypothetical protein